MFGMLLNEEIEGINNDYFCNDFHLELKGRSLFRKNHPREKVSEWVLLPV
jgi:hypothetical protein